MTKKTVLTIIISLIVVAGIVIGGFFAIFPMKPEVEIKSAQERIENKEEILVASYNTAAPWGNLIEGTYTTRRMHLWANQINETLPDSLGVQEINSIWVSGLEKMLPQYAYYGIKRGGDENEQKSEMNGIYYLKDKFNLLESDTFWISETPDTKSKYENAGCYRICSYVVLENKASGFFYIHLNTHFDNSSIEAQNLGGKLVIEYADKLAQKYENAPIVITGDFNQYSDGESVKLLIDKGYTNANNGDKTPTYHGWGENSHTEPIDYIFVKGFTTSDYKVHSDTNTKTDISDHYMISTKCTVIE
ncbi:MAG: endonuclease/exonuclease/phosphatase family protein [Clostridia bacterium]|nr:endonuclease/exonuclease/phosphatase family protein [Clostridia bacterium]